MIDIDIRASTTVYDGVDGYDLEIGMIVTRDHSLMSVRV
jgi:hypothetical protein